MGHSRVQLYSQYNHSRFCFIYLVIPRTALNRDFLCISSTVPLSPLLPSFLLFRFPKAVFRAIIFISTLFLKPKFASLIYLVQSCFSFDTLTRFLFELFWKQNSSYVSGVSVCIFVVPAKTKNLN